MTLLQFILLIIGLILVFSSGVIGHLISVGPAQPRRVGARFRNLV